MRIPLSWLNEYINCSTLSVDEIADSLTLAGLEVEGVSNTVLSFSGVVVAKILTTAPHPQADKLSLTTVTDGETTYQVVCGAPNCREGMHVALAKVGAKLENGAIKRSKIRGVESQGMLCARSELALGEDEDSGIMELEESIPLGTSLETLYKDTIFEVALTPNLGHCTGIVGIARELSAITSIPLRSRKTPSLPQEKKTALQVTINTDACSRYAARIVRGVSVTTSPEWLRQRLENAGIRSINTVVDTTNYVMLELGQPMHAFDAACVTGSRIIVDEAAGKEELITLDETQRTIPKGTLLIYDKTKPLAIAGIMGGHSSAVSEESVDIILESANFDASAVRKASKALSLRSESSSRFEKKIDPLLQKKAIERATELLCEIAHAQTIEAIVETIQRPYTPKTIAFSVEQCNRILGTHLRSAHIRDILARLKMEVSEEGDMLSVTPPSYRNDIAEPIDLVEEVARIYGFNNIPRKPLCAAPSTAPHAPIYTMECLTRESCIGLGLQEFLTCDLISPHLAEIPTGLDSDANIYVLKPSSIDQSILRTSLLPPLLDSIKKNFDRSHFDISAFEIGNIHFKEGSAYKERPTVGIILTGKEAPAYWGAPSENTSFFTLKGYAENLLEKLRIPQPSFERSAFATFHPGIQAAIFCRDIELGVLGEVHPEITQQCGIDQKVFYMQLDLRDLYECRLAIPQMEALPKFPGSQRDWTVTVGKDVEAASVVQTIESVPSKLLKEISIHDLYTDDTTLGADKKNLTLRMLFRSDAKTVKQEAVDKEFARIIETAKHKLAAG